MASTRAESLFSSLLLGGTRRYEPDEASPKPHVRGLWDTRRTAMPDHPDLRRHQPDPADGRGPQDVHRGAVVQRPAPLLRRVREVDGGPQALGEVGRRTGGEEMHVIQVRVVVGHVGVDGGDLDPPGSQCLGDRCDLLAEEGEVAGDGRLAATERLEVDDGAHTEGRGQVDVAAHGDGLASGDAVLLQAAASVRTRSPMTATSLAVATKAA